MKTTVKLDGGKALQIEPCKDGVKLSIRVGQISVGSMALDASQLGAVLFGIEQAAEAAGIAGHREALL